MNRTESRQLTKWAAIGGALGGLFTGFGWVPGYVGSGVVRSVLLGGVYGAALGALAAKALAPSLLQALRAIRARWVRELLGLAILWLLLVLTRLIARVIHEAVLSLGQNWLLDGAAIGTSFAVAVWIVRAGRWRPMPPLPTRASRGMPGGERQ